MRQPIDSLAALSLDLMQIGARHSLTQMIFLRYAGSTSDFMDDAFTFSSTSQPSRGKGREYEFVHRGVYSETKTGRPVLSSLGGELDQLSEIKTWSRPRCVPGSSCKDSTA